jgi:hypothetical protein
MVDDQSPSASREAKLQSEKLGIGNSNPTSAFVRVPRPSRPWHVAQLASQIACPLGGMGCETAATVKKVAMPVTAASKPTVYGIDEPDAMFAHDADWVAKCMSDADDTHTKGTALEATGELFVTFGVAREKENAHDAQERTAGRSCK